MRRPAIPAILKRLDGPTCSRAANLTPSLETELAEPLGADLVSAFNPGDHARCADIIWRSDLQVRTDWSAPHDLADDRAMVVLGYVNRPVLSGLGVVNTTQWRRAQVPSTNLHATARGVARLSSALVAGGTIDGVTVCDADVLGEAIRPQSEGWCPFLERDVTFGLGFQPTRPARPFGPNVGSFGHFGTAGALGFCRSRYRRRIRIRDECGQTSMAELPERGVLVDVLYASF